MKLLFVSHESSRTGASLMLLYFLQWLKKERTFNHNISLLMLTAGELEDDFKAEVDNYYRFWKTTKGDNFSEWEKKGKFHKLFQFEKRRPYSEEVIEVLRKQEFDIIYANTIVSIPTATAIKRATTSKLVVHVHELETQIELLLPDIRNYDSEIDAFIGVSRIVKETLVTKYLIDKNKIRTIYGFTRKIDLQYRNRNQEFTVIGAGTVGWPKRCDLFIQVAFLMKKIHPEKKVKFNWFGSFKHQEEILLTGDIKKAGLEGIVEFHDEKKDLQEWILDSHIVLMTSREESLGLVAVEAGLLETPVICFNSVTGFSEIISDGAGIKVPYLDIIAMVEGIAYYYENRDKLIEHGKMAQEQCSRLTVNNQGKKIVDFILSI